MGTRFNDWISARISLYGFQENQDFVTFTGNAVKGRPATEYHITLDMAKELAMVERNEKGKQARQYFIECERRLKVAAPHAIPQSLPEALRLAADLAEQNSQQALLIEQQKLAVEFVERYVEAQSSRCLSDVAKLLGWKPQSFTKQLSQDGIVFKRDSAWVPSQPHVDSGRFTVRAGVRHGFSFNQTRVTPKGTIWLTKRYGGWVE